VFDVIRFVVALSMVRVASGDLVYHIPVRAEEVQSGELVEGRVVHTWQDNERSHLFWVCHCA
jgi:hypothetical protein